MVTKTDPLWLMDWIMTRPDQWDWSDVESHQEDGENVAWKQQRLTCNGKLTVMEDGRSYPIARKFRVVVMKTMEKSFLIWKWEEMERIPVNDREVYEGIVIEDGIAFKSFRRIGTDKAGNEYQLGCRKERNRHETTQGWVEITNEDKRELPVMERGEHIVKPIQWIGWDSEGKEYLLKKEFLSVGRIDGRNECGYCGWIRENVYECENCSSG